MTSVSKISAACAGIVMAMFANGAVAAPCSPQQRAGDASGFSIGASGQSRCEIGSTNNDTVGHGVLQVNEDRIFGATPWTLLTKLDSNGGSDGGAFGHLIALDPGSDGLAGGFSIDQIVRVLFDEIMVVLKGPAAFNYAAFLVTDLIAAPDAGTYATVFHKQAKRGGGANAQDISHLSFYGRTSFAGVVETPVPAALPLLAGALGVFALIRRRKG